MYKYPELETTSELGLRWYLTPVGALPSITTILGVSESIEKKASLENWRQSLGAEKAEKHSQKARDHGSVVHLLAERFLKGEDVTAKINGAAVSGADLAAFNALKLKLRQINKVYGQEQAVYSKALEVAGRFDVAGEYRQVPSIIDFKTAGRLKTRKDIEDYELQLQMYGIAHNELFGTDIQQGVILMSSAGGMPQEFIVKFSDALAEALRARISIFYEKILKQVSI